MPNRTQLENYYRDTRQSLELMRSTATGLLADRMHLIHHGAKRTTSIANSKTSPTNIAFDIIILMEDLLNTDSKDESEKKLEQIIGSLERVSYHRDTGLFYSWYDSNSLDVASYEISSIDNLHLALALWTLSQTNTESLLASRAKHLVDRMDFSIFYDRSTGLAHGNLHYDKNENRWNLEDWLYSSFSESRALYSVGFALGLFRNIDVTGANQRAVDSLYLEVFQWRVRDQVTLIPKTWDGGAFQLLLPDRLINESFYSERMRYGGLAYADFIMEKAKEKSMPLPAGFSASNLGGDRPDLFPATSGYGGKLGNPELVESRHKEFYDSHYRENWDSVVTPHAIFLALPNAAYDCEILIRLLASLKNAEDLSCCGSHQLYEGGLGWVDAYYVKGLNQGKVVPVQLALDQEMIALSLIELLSKDGLGPTSRALRANAQVQSSLRQFYGFLDRKMLNQ